MILPIAVTAHGSAVYCFSAALVKPAETMLSFPTLQNLYL